MPKKQPPSYRLHKATGRAIVTLNRNGKREDVPLGKYNSKESWTKYHQVIAEYLANDSKLPPTRSKKEMTCGELATKFIEWAEGYYLDYDGKPNETANHCRYAVTPMIQHYGDNPVSDFVPTSLMFLQEKWIKAGRCRPTINRWSRMVKQCFKHGVKMGWVEAATWQTLTAVDNLQEGRTTAAEYQDIQPVPDEIVDATLPFLPPIVADMVRVQRLIGGRPQDVYNMRVCDINRNGDVWAYRPYKHKGRHKGKDRTVAVGPQAQAILAPYIARKVGDDFIFSPKDSMAIFREEQRANRKTKVQPSQEYRKKKNPKRQPGEHYTKDSYNRAVHVACKRLGIEPWSPNQLRHSAATEVTANFSLEAAKEFLGHASIKTTEKHYVAPLPELAAKVAREIG